ncbi:hypothetical protein [Dysgonomonas sp. ZJ279]|uniref:hypothetical protein n=1 Tax=Dysgonomonas sp. ZJ279 TaxID=2709796 RepID=UPI0013E99EFD|nr:hypothetical protein [Dysgonomonas sp. ZJ279]
MINFTRGNNTIIEDQTYNNTETVIEFPTNGAVFKHCIFKENLIFKNVNLNSGLYFEDCSFEKNVFISNCKSEGGQNIVIQRDSGATITFDKCTIKNQLFISGVVNDAQTHCSPTVFQRGLLIKDNTEINELIFNYSETKNVGITINKSIIKQKIDLNHSQINGAGLHIWDSNIQGYFRAMDISGSSFAFIKSNFEKSFQIWGNKFLQGVTFNYGVYNEDVEIYATECKTLTIYDGDFRKHMRIRCIDSTREDNHVNGCAKEVYIKNSKFGDKLSVTSNYETKYDLDKIIIRSTKEQKGDIVFEKLNIHEELSIEGSNYDSNISFRDISCKKIKIDNLTNLATLVFWKLSDIEDNNSLFEIKGSDLGNTTFLNCRFKDFKNIIIEDSILSQIKYSRVEWFKSNQINKNINRKNSEYWNSIREVFRQLKYSAENNMNRPEALYFKASEMKAYNNYLLKDGWFKNIGDIIILKLNLWSNTHGLNWGKAIAFTLILWIVFFSLYVMIRDGYSFQFYDNNIFLLSQKTFWKEAISFLWLPEGLESLTGNDRLFTSDLSWKMSTLGVSFFLLGKIAIAYGIFQIISAFRKYVK